MKLKRYWMKSIPSISGQIYNFNRFPDFADYKKSFTDTVLVSVKDY